ncbi:PAS domain S-box protein [Rasiella rasia]|uniref:histidine kinase n=1 Tax=Rasiella rasia TaxID=2744027 RepID=A0A6G6GM38_9FLAO|nr:HAMP domain-containing sensor histidine kinase [Rasiella rasia]QIE59473.1 PAS domain S-box protein [Rasiella rasia]
MNETSLSNEEHMVNNLEPKIYTKLLAALKSGIWHFNFQTQEVALDTSFFDVIGFDSDTVPVQKIQDVIRLVHPREQQQFDFLFAPDFKTFPVKFSFEFRILHKEKKWIWLENHCEIIADNDEKLPKKLTGFVQDVTERKENELLSIKYEDLLRKTNEAASIGTWEVDLVANEISWSDVTKQIHEVAPNYKPELATGINFYKEGLHRTKITELFETCVAKGRGFDDEFLIETNTGKEKWVRSIGIAVMEKGVCTKVYGVFQDIDDKTRALERLAKAEEKFRQTFDFAGVGLAMVGMDTNWIRVNQSLCAMLGYTMEEFLQLTYLDFTHPDDLEADKVLFSQALEGNIGDYKTEKRYLHKNGKVIWTILTVSLVRDENGEPLHFLSQVNNISKIKRAENKVKELLEITKDQNDRLLNFAHIVSHNLRSHSGNLEMLLGLIKMDNPEISELELFPLLESAVSQLGETVHNLNEVAVLNTKTELNLENLNLSDYVNKAIANINTLVLDNSVKLENRVDSAIMVSAIPAYLDSIILNFLTNAIKYQSNERIPEIVVEAIKEKNFIKMSIKDNGLGIDLDAHGKKLFGMYKTFHKHEDSRGLGLFITRNQIEAMGGKVDVASEVNRGTTFFIYLLNEEN